MVQTDGSSKVDLKETQRHTQVNHGQFEGLEACKVDYQRLHLHRTVDRSKCRIEVRWLAVIQSSAEVKQSLVHPRDTRLARKLQSASDP